MNWIDFIILVIIIILLFSYTFCQKDSFDGTVVMSTSPKYNLTKDW